VNVREPFCLGELGDAGLLAAENLMQCLGQADLPRSQCLGLCLGEFADRCNVPTRHQAKPARQGGIKGMDYPPVIFDGDALPGRQVAYLG
jgi:hypothetical protein